MKRESHKRTTFSDDPSRPARPCHGITNTASRPVPTNIYSVPGAYASSDLSLTAVVQRLNAVEMKLQGTNAALQAQIDTLKLRNAKLESSLAHVLACGAARPWGRCARCQLMLGTMPTTNASSASDMPVTNASSASDSEVVTM